MLSTGKLVDMRMQLTRHLVKSANIQYRIIFLTINQPLYTGTTLLKCALPEMVFCLLIVLQVLCKEVKSAKITSDIFVMKELRSALFPLLTSKVLV